MSSHYVLRSSGISRKSGALWDTATARKKECVSFVFYCFEYLSIVITLEPMVRFRRSFQQNVPLLMKTSINKFKKTKKTTENVTCSPSDWFPYTYSKCPCVTCSTWSHNSNSGYSFKLPFAIWIDISTKKLFLNVVIHYFFFVLDQHLCITCSRACVNSRREVHEIHFF